MTTKTLYVVENEKGEFLELAIERCVGETYVYWGSIAHATYFETKEIALDNVLGIEKELYVRPVDVALKEKEKASTLAKKIELERKRDIFTAILQHSPIARQELETVFEVIMEGEGKLLVKEKNEEKEQHIYFEETIKNGWIVKKSNIDL